MNLDIQSRAFDRRAQPRVTQSWDTHVICRCKIVLVLYNKGHRYYSLIAHQTALCMWWCLGNFKRLVTTGKWRTKHAFLAKHPHQCYHWTANKAKKALLEHYNFTNGYLIVMNLRQITQLARQTKRIQKILQQNTARPNQDHSFWSPHAAAPGYLSTSMAWGAPPWAQQEQQKLRFGHKCPILVSHKPI